MEKLRADIRYALRAARRNPAFTAIAIGTLALGIGANTAIFSVVTSALLEPLAWRDPGRLVALQENVPEMSHVYPALPVNVMHFNIWRSRMHSFESAAIIAPMNLTLTGAGPAERLNVARVSADLFHVLGIGPRFGRSFSADEDQPGRDRVAVITDQLWRTRFHADPALLGRKIILDDQPFVVIGILPADFHFPKNDQLGQLVGLPPHVDVFKPAGFTKDELEVMGDFDYGAIARLRSGVSIDQARAEMNVVQAQIAKSIKEDKIDLRGIITPLHEAVVGHARRGLLLLLGAVGAVLLMVCVNLANLLLARATGRRREAGIRTALGASRARLIRQVVTENLLLAFAGGALGIGLAFATVRILVHSAPVDLPRLDEVAVDGRVLLFAILVAVLSGLLFGVVPALRVSAADPQESLQAGGTRSATDSRRGLRLRDMLVAVEVGLSAVLLITAGLLIHSFTRLLAVDKGFNVERVLTADLSLSDAAYGERARREHFYEEVVRRIRTVPGVASAALVSKVPLDGDSWGDVISKAGDNRPMPERPMGSFRFLTPGYFETLGIRIIAGRAFEDRDHGRPLALISEKVARTVWPGENPIGRTFTRGNPDEKPLEICGVVADTRSLDLQKAPVLMVYVPYWVRSREQVSLVARTTGDPRAEESALRAAVWSVDRSVPVSQMRTMTQVMDESVGGRRFQMLLIAVFAATALLLASIGIYGVLAYSVARRTGEIGIRVALGARPADLCGMVLRQGLAPVAAGLLAGLAAALAVGRLLHALLFDVSAADPVTIVTVVVVLFAIAVLACIVPARRAMRVDPMTALRFE